MKTKSLEDRFQAEYIDKKSHWIYGGRRLFVIKLGDFRLELWKEFKVLVDKKTKESKSK